eukprot:TRINITY_DN676_c0_g1_i3.p1 TRINITY_DN676_c0_g1~~TRINITY_DN676_c0_g1_i3.p1  ORF type:complete len:298 (+),score=98.25 TRINITY_DN676_c0_g1_i3:277-1170(+)
MKLAVIIGVTQMTLGIIMGLFNHIHYKKPLNIIFEWIPQMIFMFSVFGYLVVLIFAKWLTPLPNEPYLITVVINMFLSWGKLAPSEHLYPGQNTMQMTLAGLAVLSVFVMLIPKPVILLVQHKRAQAAKQAKEAALPADTVALALDDADHKKAALTAVHEEEFEFSEVFIHQSIHTIEFVLGCISNTASYLRLWALSLAHAELSLVFYEQIFLNTVRYNFLVTMVGFAVWGFATVAVLLIMEALSAFLHALRLHWVEFQNKFYNGDGYAFAPFSLSAISGTFDDLVSDDDTPASSDA